MALDILSICGPICFKLCKGVHIWKMWFGIVDECHEDVMCICTELKLRGGVSCMPAVLLFFFENVFLCMKLLAGGNDFVN